MNQIVNQINYGLIKEDNFTITQEWLDSNDTSLYLTHNEVKSEMAEKFIKTLRLKSIAKWQLMIGNLILVIWIN